MSKNMNHKDGLGINRRDIKDGDKVWLKIHTDQMELSGIDPSSEIITQAYATPIGIRVVGYSITDPCLIIVHVVKVPAWIRARARVIQINNEEFLRTVDGKYVDCKGTKHLPSELEKSCESITVILDNNGSNPREEELRNELAHADRIIKDLKDTLYDLEKANESLSKELHET